MVIHILLFIFNSLESTIILSEFTDYFRAQEKYFLNPIISDDSKENQRLYIYYIEYLQNQLNKKVNSMLEAKDTFFNTIIFVDDDGEEMDVDHLNTNVEFKKNLNNHNEFSMPLKLNYLINQSDLGHFNSSYSGDEIKNYLNIITKLK